jgi:hypothetical protein
MTANMAATKHCDELRCNCETQLSPPVWREDLDLVQYVDVAVERLVLLLDGILEVLVFGIHEVFPVFPELLTMGIEDVH